MLAASRLAFQRTYPIYFPYLSAATRQDHPRPLLCVVDIEHLHLPTINYTHPSRPLTLRLYSNIFIPLDLPFLFLSFAGQSVPNTNNIV